MHICAEKAYDNDADQLQDGGYPGRKGEGKGMRGKKIKSDTRKTLLERHSYRTVGMWEEMKPR